MSVLCIHRLVGYDHKTESYIYISRGRHVVVLRYPNKASRFFKAYYHYRNLGPYIK
jgi:hypothetical protein